MTTTINYINTQQPASIDHLHFSPNTSLPSIHAIMDVDYHTDQQTQSPEGSDPTDTHESSLTLDSDSHPSSPTLSSTSAPLFGPKKFIKVRKLTTLPSQLKLEPAVRQEILHQISTPASSTTVNRTTRPRATPPTFDFLDFQHHSPAFLANWLQTHKFRQQDLAHRSNKWRTVDRHSGASTQLIVFQCKCGIPPKLKTGNERYKGGVRMYPYLRCKAFVHMTCDAEGSPLVVRGFFTHTPACMDSTTLSTPRLNIDPKFERLAISQLELNHPMRVILADNARRVQELSEDYVRKMAEAGTRALLCRSDVRNLRRVLLRKRPELKRIQGPKAEKRKREEEEEEEEESMELDDEDDYTVSVKSESPTISPVVSKKRLKVTPTPSPAATTAPPSPTLPSPIDYPDPAVFILFNLSSGRGSSPRFSPSTIPEYHAPTPPFSPALHTLSPSPCAFQQDHWTGVDVTNWREVVGI